ncbi:MAG: protoporphyrinogen oxidase [Candidatus Omnitrophica bacterium]|nr:protoporphyrinogen oxidase [Candidatus Omnitrophota bacterium]
MSLNATHEAVVIGAGVSGLALAHDLHRAGLEALVLEKGSEPGGCARTHSESGFLFERGPFNLLVRNPLFESLLGDLNDRVEVVPPSPSAKRREILLGGMRRKVPMSLPDALATPLLSPAQKLRALAEPLLGHRPTSADPTLGDLIRRRFGNGIADRVVSAVVAGVFGGDLDQLSARSCFPLLWEVDQSSSSLILGLIRKGFQSRKNPRRKWKGMISFRDGVGGFCRAMASVLGERLHLNTGVESIERIEGGYRVHVRSSHGESGEIRTARLILGTDLPAARGLLSPWARPVAELLEPIESVSLAVVNAGFGPEAFPTAPEGFGFLVPKVEKGVSILGALFASSVFPHQAPEGCHSIRIFIGGTRSPGWVRFGDEELVERALAELARFLPIKAKPRALAVSKWPDSVPQMKPGHFERIAEVEGLLEREYPGLHLVGNYLHGVSVNDCVVHARTTAARLLAG